MRMDEERRMKIEACVLGVLILAGSAQSLAWLLG